MESNIYGYIYKITNLINNKCYIGQTIGSITKRFKEHIRECKCPQRNNMIITKAIKKYSIENFKIEQIDVAYSQKELNLLEGIYISWFNTLNPNGYNLTNIINGKGKPSKETIKKLKIARNKPDRIKSHSEIAKKHRGKTINNTSSKYIGVYICNKTKKYKSQIVFNNKRYNLGSYMLESDAGKSYDIHAIKYFGKNAILNFPELREDYINGYILVKKSSLQDNSISGEKGVYFNKQKNVWFLKWKNKENKIKTKRFKTKEDTIKYKYTIIDQLF